MSTAFSMENLIKALESSDNKSLNENNSCFYCLRLLTKYIAQLPSHTAVCK